MLKSTFLYPSVFLGYFLFFSCDSTKQSAQNAETSLKTAYKNDFHIGVAIGNEHINESNPQAVALIAKEFNTITPENIMKCAVIHPEEKRYDFTMADKFVAYGQKNKMWMVGHCLVWHSQLAKFANNIQSRDSFQMFFEDHIKTIAGRYDGKINGWDVVNEALNEDGTMRKSIFYNRLGDSYIEKAFAAAQKAAPNTELYYNDYNIEQPKKRQGAIDIIKRIKKSGARIDGVGIQAHWSINGPPLKEIEESILEFSSLGVKVMFTELDLTALPNPWDLKGAEISQNYEGSQKMNPYPTALPDSMQIKLAHGYEDLFKLFLKHKDKVSRVTFWGVNDGHSWLNGWPIKGRTNYPLLFDREYKPKLAYKKVMALKNEK
jgi:endo-1,4-beta-xylanase